MDEFGLLISTKSASGGMMMCSRLCRATALAKGTGSVFTKPFEKKTETRNDMMFSPGEPPMGVELKTYRLRNDCSAELSYGGVERPVGVEPT